MEKMGIFLGKFMALFSIFAATVLSRTIPFSSNPALLHVSSTIWRTQDLFALNSQSVIAAKHQRRPVASPDSGLSFKLHSRVSVRGTSEKDYKALTLARLARDSARVEAIQTRLDLARLGIEKADLTPLETGFEEEKIEGPVISGTSQGSGEYFCRVGVGNPPTQAYMVLDTGSDVNWVQCAPCADCYQQADPIYDPGLSSSFTPLTCETQQCRSLDVSECRNDTCLYEVSYGDGSYTVGDFVTETITFGGSSAVNNVAIGCGHNNEGLFVGAAGLIGLGGGALSFPSQINATSFSYCLVDRDSDSASTLEFNSAAPPDAVTAPLLHNSKLDTFYYIDLAGIRVAGELLSIPPSTFQLSDNGNGGVIIDSGTAVTRLQTEAYNSMRDAFKKGAKDLPSTDGVALFDTCYDLSSRKSVEVPTVSFRFSNGKELSLPAKNYMIPGTNFVEADTGKEVSSSRKKATSKRRLPISENSQSGGSVAQKAMVMKDEKSVKHNVAFEDYSQWDEIDKKNNFDVVSFTFTSPIKKSVGSKSCSRILEATSSSSPNRDPCARECGLSSAASSSGFNVIGGDALSVLLEQKLKELTSRVEFSQKDMSESDSLSNSVKNYGNVGTSVNLVKSLPLDKDVCKSKQEIQDASDCASVVKPWLQNEEENKGLLYCEGNGDNNNSAYQRYLQLQGSVSVSSQLSLSGASSDSFDIDRSLSNDGRMACLSLESYEGMNSSSTRKALPAESDVEISDTASSLSVGTISEAVSSSVYMTDSKLDSSIWELKYIGDILSHGELLLEEFSLGQAHKIIAPDLFDQLENQKTDPHKVMEEHVHERKVWFDCICECLEVRCEQLLAGSSKFWAKQMTMMSRRQWLAGDFYREISSWKNGEELMVDELVEKDMSSKNGKWIDFEIEGFEEGVEVGNRILTSLVDELIDDFLF